MIIKWITNLPLQKAIIYFLILIILFIIVLTLIF